MVLFEKDRLLSEMILITYNGISLYKLTKFVADMIFRIKNKCHKNRERWLFPEN